MSITKCKFCDNDYDQDVDVEHEEVCKESLKEAERKKFIAKCPYNYRGCYSRYMLSECGKCGHHRGHHQKYARGCWCAECDEE